MCDNTADERDDARIHTIFEDIAYYVEQADYHIQEDFPGLTSEEKKCLRTLRRQMKDIADKVQQVGKL